MSSPAPRRRGNPSLADMVLTVLALGGILLAVWFFAQFVYGWEPEDVVPKVDHVRLIADARRGADQRLFAPTDLPDGWRANSVRFESTDPQQLWHVGMLTAADEYIGLDQAKRSAEKMIETYAKGSESDGKATLGGVEWDRRQGAEGELVFITEIDGTVAVVVGDAPRKLVEDYVSSLDAS